MAEELTRSLAALAERGVPRGARVVLEAARADANGQRAPWWVAQPAWVGAGAKKVVLRPGGVSCKFRTS